MTVDPDKNAAAPVTALVKKPRNAVELFIVRGGIALLVVLAAVQAHARLGYEYSLKKFQHHLASEEETTLPLLIKDVPGMLVGFPSRSKMEERHWHAVVYKWQGITQAYEIRMLYDSSENEPAVLALETADAPPPPPLVQDDSPATESAPQPDYAAMAGGGRGPGMGGGPRPDPMANDKDGDGRLSKEEAPERMAANFEQWDANSDGFVDKDEIEAGRARFAQRRGGGGGGGQPPGGDGERRQRPAAESDKPAAESANDADKSPEGTPAKESEKAADAPADAAKVSP